MNFKHKCFLQNIFSVLPRGEILNYFFQRYGTRALPVSNDSFLDKVELSYNHYLKFLKFNSLEENSQKYYEFGAGWDLIIPVSMGFLGFEVTCIDIRRLIFKQLISDTLLKFKSNMDHLPFTIDQLDIKDNQSPLDFLKNRLNFNYIAPLDARNTKFNSDYFDFVTSTVTFEHIPEQDLYLILIETYRILKPGGILLLKIDYRDHWAYFDKSISFYNFLTYSEKEWVKFNPSIHYQNRLRHKDYLDIISNTNFKIMEDDPELPTQEDLEILEKLKLNSRFKGYNINNLGIKGSQIVLRK